MIAINPSVRPPQNPIEQSRSVAARLRQRQLELAREGRVLESVEYAERAQRILDHLQRGAVSR